MEHPDITAALRTGYPRGYKEPESYQCPICGKEPEFIIKDLGGDVIACSECSTKEYID